VLYLDYEDVYYYCWFAFIPLLWQLNG
jgi:hypothetical protein